MSESERPRVGFIGVGLMGHGLAKNVVEKGYPLTVLDAKPEPVADLVRRGAKAARTPAEVARASDIVFYVMNTSKNVEEATYGPQGLKEAARPGLTLVNSTTTEVTTTERLAVELTPLGVTVVDGPLTRTPPDAEAGRVNILLGTDEATLDRIRPVLKTFAENLIHIGPYGHAIRVKLIHNYIAFANVASYCEGMALAAKMGLDLGRFVDVISTAGANSGMFQLYARPILKGDFSVKMSLANALKDVRYYTHMAEDEGLPGFLAQSVHQTWALAAAIGLADQNCNAIIQAFEKLTGVPARVPAPAAPKP